MGTDAAGVIDAAPFNSGPAEVRPAARLRGELRMPGDKSISHRALMFALLADGESRIQGASDGADVRSTAGIIRALGAVVEASPEDGGTVAYRVVSPGGACLPRTAGPLDCGNSGTSLRLFAGILAGIGVAATLDGDASLRRRPMARVVDPLRAMGARIDAGGADGRPPLRLGRHDGLTAVDWTTPVPSAQVKSAILLAGLGAAGTTRVHESVATRDHTERMLRARGVDVRTNASGDGVLVEVDGPIDVRAMDGRVPGDPSAAAFWMIAAAVHPDAVLTIRNVGANPTRRGLVDLLVRMGADIEERAVASSGPGDDGDSGEPIADYVVRSSSLRAIEVSPEEVAGAIDEVPILCLAASQAVGRTTIRGAGELRLKESDRLAGIATGLAALGAAIRLDGDDVIIDGPTSLHGAATDSLDDHRLAMTFAVAGLIAAGSTTVGQPGSASISYPGFFRDLERIRA